VVATALVTGGAGLIGSHVVDLLRTEGIRVKVLDVLVRPTHTRPPDWLRSDVEYVVADVRDRDALAEALDGVEILFHLAAFGGFAPGIAPYFDVNVTAYATILEVAKEIDAPLRRAVVASSQAVYGEGSSSCAEHGTFNPGPRLPAALEEGSWEVPCPRCGAAGAPVATPEEAVDPVTPYAVSKWCLEHVAHRIGETGGIGTTSLRYGLTYGPRQSATNAYCGIIALFSQRLLRGEPVLVYEDGAQTRDFVHVEDVARATVAVALDDRARGRTFNVGTGVGTAIVEIVSQLAALLDVEAETWLPGWFRPGDVRHLVTDASKLRALGWEPRVELVDGLEDYVVWMRGRPLPDDPLPAALERMRAGGIVRERPGEAPALAAAAARRDAA
jgi:dTDP-L-rhamnose 4-epimerase